MPQNGDNNEDDRIRPGRRTDAPIRDVVRPVIPVDVADDSAVDDSAGFDGPRGTVDVKEPRPSAGLLDRLDLIAELGLGARPIDLLLGRRYSGSLDWGPLRESTGPLIESYKELDETRPIVLLPVRIETIYHPPVQPTELRIRIYPDDLHSNDLQTGLTEAEKLDGEAFWTQWWQAGGHAGRERAAWDGLVGVHGATRAAWIARQLEPTDPPERWPTAPTPEGDTLAKGPSFPAVTVTSRVTPGESRALPRRFCALGLRRRDNERFIQFGNQIPTVLHTSPDPTRLPSEPGPTDALLDPQAAWLIDYAEAVLKGMAITIVKTELNAWAFDEGVDQLFVFGVDERLDPQQEVPGVIEELLRAHAYTRGMEFIEPGSPTNNTEEAQSPWTRRPTDNAARLTREIREKLDETLISTQPDDAASLFVDAIGLAAGSVARRFAGRDRLDERHARNMNLSLWHTTLGFLLSVLSDSESSEFIGEETVDWVRDWMADYVRGGGPLPTLGVGAQPYGVLPVMWQSTLRSWPAEMSTGQSRLYTLHSVLMSGRTFWEKSQWAVPRVGVDPTHWSYSTIADVDGDGIDDSLLQVLYHQPHPIRFHSRELRWEKYDDNFWGLFWPELNGLAGAYNWYVWWAHYMVEGGVSSEELDGWDVTLANEGLPTAGLNDALRELRSSFSNIDTQIDAWKAFRSAVNSKLRWLQTEADTYGANSDKRRACLDVSADMSAAYDLLRHPIDLLGKHKKRLEALSATSYAVHDAMGGDGPLLGYGLYDEEAKELERPVAHLSDEEGNPVRPWTYLDWLADRCRPHQVANGDLDDPLPPALAATDTPPILYSLIRQAILRVGQDQEGHRNATGRAARMTALKEAIEQLEDLDADTLERVTAETLGLSASRYDAWVTSLATERLARMRTAKATGATLGAYGWVLDLKPDNVVQDSKGFVHAPSLQQAVTASVLRSGWLTHGEHSEDDAAAMAVDLGSGRVRLARWLFDAVRQGQAVGDVLGYRFERILHDSGLDSFIDEFREAATAIAVELGEQAVGRTVVDGLMLAENRGHGRITTVLFASGVSVIQRTALNGALDTIEAMVDAAADAAIAQGVHSALLGDHAGASSVFASISTGDAPPPQLESMKTLRASTAVTHRVVAVWDNGDRDQTWGGSCAWSESCPAVAAWAGRLLGDPDSYAIDVEIWRDDRRVDHQTISAGAVGLSSLEWVRLAPAGEGEVPMEIERRVARVPSLASELKPGTRLVVDWDVQPGDQTPGADLLLLARRIRVLMAKSRPLAPEHFMAAGAEAVPGRFLRPLERRRAQMEGVLTQALTTLEGALPDEGPPRMPLVDRVLEQLVPFGVVGATAAFDATAAARARAGRVVLQIVRRRLSAAAEAPDVPSAVQALLGITLPVPSPFRVQGAKRLDANFGRSEERIAAAYDDGLTRRAPLSGWLWQVAKVQEGAAVLAEVVELAEALGDGAVESLAVAQLPDLSGDIEPWVGRAAPPSDGPPRVSIVAWMRPGLTFFEEDQRLISGLLIDTWNDLVPTQRQVTGIALHHDAPQSRAPQAILVMVPPDTMSWSWDLVVETLKQTVELAKMRGVDTDGLQLGGHLRPATYI